MERMYHEDGKEFTTRDYVNRIVSLEKKVYNPDGSVKLDIEFSRYKQDCRKRALEIAVQIRSTPSLQMELDEDNRQMTDLKKIADKYYNWLINIPQ